MSPKEVGQRQRFLVPLSLPPFSSDCAINTRTCKVCNSPGLALVFSCLRRSVWGRCCGSFMSGQVCFAGLKWPVYQHWGGAFGLSCVTCTCHHASTWGGTRTNTHAHTHTRMYAYFFVCVWFTLAIFALVLAVSFTGGAIERQTTLGELCCHLVIGLWHRWNGSITITTDGCLSFIGCLRQLRLACKKKSATGCPFTASEAPPRWLMWRNCAGVLAASLSVHLSDKPATDNTAITVYHALFTSLGH